MKAMPLLSIAIPAFSRLNELEFGLNRFISQIVGKYEDEIEIVVSDDHSPGDGLRPIQHISERYHFVKYRRYPQNIGLESNLIACAQGCTGEFLWLFGDDDFIEPDDGLDQIMQLLCDGKYDFYVLNRTRRSFDLSKLISDNWMKLDSTHSFEYPGLRQFCIVHGFISIIGFISVNIFRRAPFLAVDSTAYFGTMYPQLGAMVAAFHNRKTLLVGKPLICHRTQTAEEKSASLGTKKTEADFMADYQRRNAIYFSHPYVAMLQDLMSKGAFTPDDIIRIPENTVINGLLIDFLIQTVTLNHKMGILTKPGAWTRTAEFFGMLPLDSERRRRIDPILSAHSGVVDMTVTEDGPSCLAQEKLTISVVTPSYNQAEFLRECLSSARDQTYKAIEHFVFDPGSTDGSREIAASFPHVTLVAEPDEGQSDALNKGFRRVKGDIIAWLNSDDCFAHPDVFRRVIKRFLEKDSPDIVYGKGIYVDESGATLRDVYLNKVPTTLPWRFQQEDGILQPALFMKRSVVERIGPLRNDLHYSMDYEYWIRCVKAGLKFAYVDEIFALARYHSNNKTYGMRGNSYSEVCDMMKEHFGYVNHIWLKRYAEFLADGHDGVLATASNAGTRNSANLERIYRELVNAYNAGYDSYNLLLERAAQKGYGDTLREMKALQIMPPVPCRPIPLTQTYETGCVSYTVGPRRWAFDSKWKADQISKAHGFLREQIAQRRKDTCVIVGNGPSLNKTDLSLLKGQDVIVSNNVFLSKELLEHATYYTVVNYLVAEQSSHHINRLERVFKILPYWLAYCLNPGPNTFFVDAVGYPEFSKDIFKNMSWRHTVTFFNLHLAYGLGYRRVVMIGFDHNYTQPKGVVEQEVIQSYEADENHFHPAYFRGKKWQAADVDMMEEMYRLASAAYLEDGREIINSTVGGKLELFPRMELGEALGCETTCNEEPIPSVNASRLLPSHTLVGPFSRETGAHWDETEAVAYLFSHTLDGKAMIDVGAHHGWALNPFLNKGWRVFAFEPDDENRKKLLERITKHKNAALLKLDDRAVSDEIKKGVPFYRSVESTGISGLSAFHPSHEAKQTVETVTLREALAGETIPSIDFLKIDTEGHDLFVLKGFPWDRFYPAVVECEFEDLKTVPLGYTFHDLAQYLIEKGYTVYVSEWHPIVRYGIRHDWQRLVRYPCDLTDEKSWGNLLAFRDPLDETRLVEAVETVLKVMSSGEVTGKQLGQTAAAASDTTSSRVMAVQKVVAPALTPAVLQDSLKAVGPIGVSKVLPREHFRRVSPKVWRYRYPGAEQPSLWHTTFDVGSEIQDREYVAGITLKADKAIEVRVSLARFGKTPYEGTSLTLRLAPGVEENVQLRRTFSKQHSALKVQIEVLHVEGGEKTDLSIDCIYLNESLESIRRRIPDDQIGLRMANRLFREGHYQSAMGIYLHLHAFCPLRIYQDNALMCARRMVKDSAESAH